MKQRVFFENLTCNPNLVTHLCQLLRMYYLTINSGVKLVWVTTLVSVCNLLVLHQGEDIERGKIQDSFPN